MGGKRETKKTLTVSLWFVAAVLIHSLSLSLFLFFSLSFCWNGGGKGPDWYAPSKELATIDTHTWGRYPWFEYWEREHRQCRDNVVLIDMSFMSKFIVQGRDAGAVLSRLSTANVDGGASTITYTQWLNDSGRMEADLTVSKLDDDKVFPSPPFFFFFLHHHRCHSCLTLLLLLLLSLPLSSKFFIVATDTMHRHVETHVWFLPPFFLLLISNHAHSHTHTHTHT